MKVVFFEEWTGLDHRVQGTTEILRQLASLAEKRKAA
jgi:transcription-repair coupling factor (superfamily II helicase)